jgi:hypothetical protein
MAFFLIDSIIDPLLVFSRSLPLLRAYPSASLAYRLVLGNWVFGVVLHIVAAIAGWKILKGARRARRWKIAASLGYIAYTLAYNALFIWPLGFSLRPVWSRHIGYLLAGVITLAVFLRQRLFENRSTQ